MQPSPATSYQPHAPKGNGSGLIFFGLLLVALSQSIGPLFDRVWPVEKPYRTESLMLSGAVSTGGTMQLMPYPSQPLQIEIVNKSPR